MGAPWRWRVTVDVAPSSKQRRDIEYGRRHRQDSCRIQTAVQLSPSLKECPEMWHSNGAASNSGVKLLATSVILKSAKRMPAHSELHSYMYHVGKCTALYGPCLSGVK